MKIINLHEESFSNDFVSLKKLENLDFKNYDIVDVGYQSTKPNFTKVNINQEIKHLNSSILTIYDQCKISVDSYKKQVIRSIFLEKVSILNVVFIDFKDVSFFSKILCKNKNLRICIVYSKTANSIFEIKSWFIMMIVAFELRGISRNRIIIDPGYGYNKSTKVNFEIICNFQSFSSLGCQTLIGISRKKSLYTLFDQGYEIGMSEIDIISKRISEQINADIIRIHSE